MAWRPDAEIFSSGRMHDPLWNRRDFVRSIAAGALGIACAQPFGPQLLCSARSRPVRVRGRVQSSHQGIARVPVTDGRTVVLTGPDGGFDFTSESTRPYIYLSVPDGYEIPRRPSGIAEFYQPLGLCSVRSGDEAEVVFELSPLPDSSESHTMLMLADPQVADQHDLARMRRETLPELVAFGASRKGNDAFGMTCGDLVFDNLSLFGAYEQDVSAIDLPFFQVAGNHDLRRTQRSDAGAKSEYIYRFGPRYYSFDRGDIHYVCLDNVHWRGEDYRGYVDRDQLAWLAADLEHVEPGRTVVVIQHIPMLGTHHQRHGSHSPDRRRSVSNREEVYRLLEPFRTFVLAGHVHESEHLLEGPVEEHQNGAVCGAFWTGPICADGTPNGYVIYEGRGSELRWQYKATGLAPDQQMTLYPRDADPRFPDACVANVWFWDPSWTVRWYEDGEPRGAMIRRTGRDPLAVRLYEGPSRPAERPWVRPFRTDHLFYAEPSPGASQIRVEATDPFGRVFTSERSIG